MTDLKNLEEWRQYVGIGDWTGFDIALDGWAYHRGKGEIPGIYNDLAQMIDFLAGRVRALEAQDRGGGMT